MSNNDDLTRRPENNLPPKIIKTKSLPKNKTGLFTAKESLLHEDLDKDCLYKFDNPLVRIEYPGRVNNVEKAIETLGGIDAIQKAIEGKRLQLCFHPKSQYMKGCVADVDQSVGILVKVKQDKDSEEVSYEVVGVTDTCFKFNRMCDFQYLPLLPLETPETKDSEVDYVYDKVILDKIPSLEWFNKKQSGANSLFLISGSFARFDQPQGRFQLNTAEALNSMVRQDAPQLLDFGKKALRQKVIVPSIRVSLLKNMEIPTEPLPDVFVNVRTKFLQHQLKLVKQLFEERPIWTKPAVMYKTKINYDAVKHVLPCVAYYCNGGPWRGCWIKFGYNPVTDYNSRIYQVLDFRIRHTEGMQVKIKNKRTISNNITKEFVFRHKHDFNSDASYMVRPNQIPPARQMFYQYCDIHIPEVQEMLQKLPKLPPTMKFDPKVGWLPLSCQEHCREIVNRYIFDAVRQELLKDAQRQKTAGKSDNVATYCSKMLSNIKKGFSQSVGEYSGGQTEEESTVEEIDLSDDEQIDANEVMDGLPERIPENFDDEDGDEESELEIDMEAVEEVNELVASIKDQKFTF